MTLNRVGIPVFPANTPASVMFAEGWPFPLETADEELRGLWQGTTPDEYAAMSDEEWREKMEATQ
jgi:hypothetical protein